MSPDLVFGKPELLVRILGHDYIHNTHLDCFVNSQFSGLLMHYENRAYYPDSQNRGEQYRLSHLVGSSCTVAARRAKSEAESEAQRVNKMGFRKDIYNSP